MPLLLCGISTCISFIAVPYILNQWFALNAGAATGVAMAFSGLGGAVCNPICAALISQLGWRAAILILGAVLLLLSVPGILLMFRWQSPQLAPQQKTAYQHGPVKGRMLTFVLVSLVFLSGSVGVQFAMNISIYAQSIGYALTTGATLTTMVMFGNVSGKFLYGFLCDRIGTWRATAGVTMGIFAAAMAFWLGQQHLLVLHLAALLFGFAYSISMVGISRCGIAAYGLQEFQKYIGLHTSVNNLVMAVASMFFGILFDYTHNMDVLLWITGAVCVVSLLAVWILTAEKENREKRS